MSYDIYLNDPATGETLELDGRHRIAGGTYVDGGTAECWLNVTYNYSRFFYDTVGEKGVRTLYGMTGAESAPLLRAAIGKLDGEPGGNYWEATPGNARRALEGLLAFAEARPDGVWAGG